MTASQPERRSFLLGLGGLGVTGALGQATGGNQTMAGTGYVLTPSQGEHLIHFRDRGHIYIKAGVATGSDNLALGTQQVTRGAGIPVHRHPHMDESFYVLEGSGTVSLNDVPHSIEKGATIFIPRNTWHGFENPDRELLLLWITAPAGLDGFFHETCTPPGAPPKQLTRDQIREIARKFGTEFR